MKAIVFACWIIAAMVIAAAAAEAQEPG